MPSQVRILFEKGEVTATLDDSATAEAIRRALPFEGVVNRWGDEIYFSIPVHVVETPDARQQMSVGELGYWPIGAAFCIFFGPTPMSRGDEIRPASEVTVFGKLEGDPKVFKKVSSGAKVVIERAGEQA